MMSRETTRITIQSGITAGDAERDVDRHDQHLVGERIEIGAELGRHAEALGEEAVDRVADARRRGTAGTPAASRPVAIAQTTTGTSRMRANVMRFGMLKRSAPARPRACCLLPGPARLRCRLSIAAIEPLHTFRFRRRHGSMSKKGLTYAQSGVDIDAGNRMVELIKPLVRRPRGPAPTPRSAASADCSTSSARASPIRCWSPPPTASAPRSRSRSRPASTTRSASTSSPCRSTISWCRAPSRCSSSTTSPAASSIPRSARRWSRASPKAAGRPAAR